MVIFTEDDIKAVARDRYWRFKDVRDKNIRLLACVVVALFVSSFFEVGLLAFLVTIMVVAWWLRRIYRQQRQAEEALLKMWNGVEEGPERIGADN